MFVVFVLEYVYAGNGIQSEVDSRDMMQVEYHSPTVALAGTILQVQKEKHLKIILLTKMPSSKI